MATIHNHPGGLNRGREVAFSSGILGEIAQAEGHAASGPEAR
jgi:hypothetical protein